MTDNGVSEGYPDSPREELIPEQPPLPLDVADHELAAEGEVTPPGAAPDPGDREEAFGDSPDADQLAAIEIGDQGSRPEDAANFEDNAAEWSRERT
jgi:hypothetical protein